MSYGNYGANPQGVCLPQSSPPVLSHTESYTRTDTVSKARGYQRTDSVEVHKTPGMVRRRRQTFSSSGNPFQPFTQVEYTEQRISATYTQINENSDRGRQSHKNYSPPYQQQPKEENNRRQSQKRHESRPAFTRQQSPHHNERRTRSQAPKARASDMSDWDKQTTYSKRQSDNTASRRKSQAENFRADVPLRSSTFHGTMRKETIQPQKQIRRIKARDLHSMWECEIDSGGDISSDEPPSPPTAPGRSRKSRSQGHVEGKKNNDTRSREHRKMSSRHESRIQEDSRELVARPDHTIDVILHELAQLNCNCVCPWGLGGPAREPPIFQ